MSKGQSAKRLKEIVRVFTYYGFDFLISSKLPNSKKVEPRPQALREALQGQIYFLKLILKSWKSYRIIMK